MSEEDQASRLERDRMEGQKSGIGFAMRLGTELVVATLIGAGFGYWLDAQFATDPWCLIIFLVFGALAGFKNVYRLVQPDAGGIQDRMEHDRQNE